MNSLGDKIRFLRREFNLTQEEFGRRLNIGKSTVSQYENNINIPDISMLCKIAELFNVTTDYLLDRPNKIKIKNLPILGTIRAGVPLLAHENWEGQIELPSDLNADFALKVTGDSMSWAGIYDGDLAILRQTNVAYHGDIVAAGIQDADWCATLKFFIKENNTQVLRAANPDYEDITITPNHKIIGQLVCVHKEPPSLYTYRDFLVKKDLVNTEWQDAVEMAINHGLNGKEMMNMIELFSKMVKQIK